MKRDTHYFIRNMLQLLSPALFLGALVLIGEAGYQIIEGWNSIDSAFMTLITISTVGFGEVHPLSDSGKIFTMFLIIGGVVFYGLALDGIFKILLGNRFRTFFEENRMRDKIKKLKNHFIICGGGRMALAIITELDRIGMAFVVLETNSESTVSKVKKLKKNDWLILERDALVEESLLEVSIDKAKGLATVLPTDADNLFVVLSARGLNSSLRIETRVAKENTRVKMLQAGADKVISPYAVGGMQMARSMLFPEVDDFLEIAINKANYEFPMISTVVKKGDKYDGVDLRNSGISYDGYICICIKSPEGKMLFAPPPETILEPGAELLLIGSGKERPLT